MFLTDILESIENLWNGNSLKNKLFAIWDRQHREEGLGITEVLVAVTITVIVLISTALAMTNTFEAQSVTESRNRAVAIAQGHISKAQLVAFPELGFPADSLHSDQMSGGLGGIGEYNGENIVVIDVTDTAFGVDPYEEVVVGKTDLRVSTYVTHVRPNTFDGSDVRMNQAMDIKPRRVSVIVEWDTKDGTQSVVRSIIRYPTPLECAPPFAVSNPANIPAGCKS